MNARASGLVRRDCSITRTATAPRLRTHALVAGLLLACGLTLQHPAVLRAESLAMPMNGLQLNVQLATKFQCTRNISQILSASRVWANDYQDQPPPSLQVLTNELGSPALLFCPANFREAIPTNWADVKWDQLDYTWNASVDWGDPAAVACTCRIHENVGRVEGSVTSGGFRPGWPLVTAGLKYILATPGEDVRFEFRVATNAFLPQAFQWRREHIEYVTNVTKIEDPDFPHQISWRTNVVPQAVGTNLPGATNATLLLTNVQTADDALYRVTISNQLGISSSRAWLHVGTAYAGYSTNEPGAQIYCVNNLRMLALLFGSWAADHNDQKPSTWDTLTNLDGSLMFGWPESLYCRADKQHSAPLDWANVDLNDTSYELLSFNPEDLSAPYCRCRVHGFYVEGSGEVMRSPRLDAAVPLAGGAVQLNYRLFAGRTNILEASSNLLDWTTLKTHSPTNGQFEFIDGEKLPHRFYRLRLP